MTIANSSAGVLASSGYDGLCAVDQAVLEAIPAAVYICADDGTIVRFNRRAATLWGRSPRTGDTEERFCGSFRLHCLDGIVLPHARTPMAEALRTGQSQHGKEVVVERPDGSRVVVSVHIEALIGDDGRIQGAINCFQDITERKRTEDALRASRADLDDFFENAQVAMHWVGSDGTILRANRAELELLGYSHEEYVGRHIAEFHADGAKIEQILEDLSSGRSLEQISAQLRAKDGSIKDVLVSSNARFQDGAMVNTRCVTLDVTAAKRVELLKRESERQWRELLDALPNAVYTTDRDGWITYYNDAAADLWGYRPVLGEAQWCGSFRLYWPDGSPLPHGECPMTLTLKEERPVRGMEAVLERPDGTRVPFLPFPNPLRDEAGIVVGAVNMLVDLTDRKRAEEARQQLAAIVESSDDAIVSKNLDGIIRSWNGGAERLFGYSAEEACGRSITLIIPSDREHEERNILDRIRKGERVGHYDTVRRRKDGTLVDISLTVSPVKDATGRIVGASKSARNITERRLAEAALARHAEEQRALYLFTDRLHRATSLDDVYGAALDAIRAALRCQRASILMFDSAQTMRFVAWHGLSDDYRRAVDGHSPWTSDVVDPQPIWIDDVAASDLDPALKATVAREGIGALGFVPLMTDGRLSGKFMVYYDSARTLAESERRIAVTLARQLGFAIMRVRADEARYRAEQASRESEARERAHAAELELVMKAVPTIVSIARDPECREIYGNPASYELLRLPLGANQSLSAPEEERPHHFQAYAQGERLAPEALPLSRAARGEEVRDFEYEVRFEDGSSRYLLGNASPLRDEQNNLHGAVAAFVDITDRIKAEEQRALLVAELSHRVKNTLAIVLTIAEQSFSKHANFDEARRSFDSRIRALAQTHSRLAEQDWSGVSLEALLRGELAPYLRADGGNVGMSGPPVTLAAKCALTLGLAIHEMATNAAKYGALSIVGGRVDVRWDIDTTGGKLLVSWIEAGGPPVGTPVRSGFGRLLLERALSYELGGEVCLDFAEGGVNAVIALPLGRHVVGAV